MFEAGFWEFVVIAVVALLVLGPERLPRAARVAGHWVGRARRTLATVKHEIDREIRAEELKSILERQTLGAPLETILEPPERPAVAPESPRAADPAPDPFRKGRA